MHSVKKEMEVKDSNKAIMLVTKLINYCAEKHTCQPIQFTGIKYRSFIILGGCGHIENRIQENIIFIVFQYSCRLHGALCLVLVNSRETF